MNIFKRKFFLVKMIFLIMIILGIVAESFIGKINALSMTAYIIGTIGFILPASYLQKL